MKRLFKYLAAVGVVWSIQVLTLGWCFYDIGWNDYWSWRRLYRPGLRVFSWMFANYLPGHYFSPIDRRGVVAGFTFAALTYACAFVAFVFTVRHARR